MPYVCIKLPVGPADVVQRVPRHISLTLKTLSSWRAEGTRFFVDYAALYQWGNRKHFACATGR